MPETQTPMLNGHTIILTPPSGSYDNLQGAPPIMFIHPDAAYAGWAMKPAVNTPQIVLQPFTQFANAIPQPYHPCNGNGGSKCSCGGNCSTLENKNLMSSVLAQSNFNKMSVPSSNLSTPKNNLSIIQNYPLAVNVCPKQVPDYPTIPWKGVKCYLTQIDNCNVKICYCWRVVPTAVPLHDYFISSIQIFPPCSVDPFNISQDAGRQIISDDPEHLSASLPLCPNSVLNYFRFSRPSCIS